RTFLPYRLLPPPRFFSFFLFYCPRHPRDLHSFPTRRSSDLSTMLLGALLGLLLGGLSFALLQAGSYLLDWRRFFSASELVLIALDRKSTRLNSSHVKISYAVFCLKKKKKHRK